MACVARLAGVPGGRPIVAVTMICGRSRSDGRSVASVVSEIFDHNHDSASPFGFWCRSRWIAQCHCWPPGAAAHVGTRARSSARRLGFLVPSRSAPACLHRREALIGRGDRLEGRLQPSSTRWLEVNTQAAVGTPSCFAAAGHRVCAADAPLMGTYRRHRRQRVVLTAHFRPSQVGPVVAFRRVLYAIGMPARASFVVGAD